MVVPSKRLGLEALTSRQPLGLTTPQQNRGRAVGRARTVIPSRLCVVLLSGAATACTGSSSLPATGGCSAPTPTGKVCVTVCLDEEPDGPPEPFACDIFCNLPERDSAAAATCYLPDLTPTSDCTRAVLSDGGVEVLC
jgi:hypothetical protein